MMNTTTITPNSTFGNSTIPSMKSESSNQDLVKGFFFLAYIIVSVIGLAGNCLTCYIIIKQKFMRKVIHFYTLNLALADLLVIIFYVPVEIIKNKNAMVWTMGEAFCRINYCVIPLSLAASISTLIAITLNRHRGVSKPLEWRSDTRSIVKISIPLIWFAGLVTCIPFLFVVVLKEYPPGSGDYYCYEEWGSIASERAYWITMFCLQVVVPLILMIILNTHMLIIMKGYSMRHKRSHKRIIRLVVVLVIVYAVCTSPQHIVYFWLSYADVSQINIELQQTIFKVANLLLIIHIAINPIIYGTIGELRKSFSRMLSLTRFKAVLSFRQVRSVQDEPVDEGDSCDHSPACRSQSPVTLREDQFGFEQDG